MRAHTLFRSSPPPAKASTATRTDDSQRDLSALSNDAQPRGVSAESWERARRWSSSD